jgi:hypothetical protein
MLGATSADLEGDPEAAARRKAADVELRAALDALGDLPGRASGQVIAYDHAVRAWMGMGVSCGWVWVWVCVCGGGGEVGWVGYSEEE